MFSKQKSKVVPVLLELLKHKEDWVRHSAAWSLEKLTGKRRSFDWFYTSIDERDKEIKFWKAAVKKK